MLAGFCHALLGGATTTLLFLTHGAIFLSLKTDGEFRFRARALATRLAVVSAAVAAVFVIWTQVAYSGATWTWAAVALAAAEAFVGARWLSKPVSGRALLEAVGEIVGTRRGGGCSVQAGAQAAAL